MYLAIEGIDTAGKSTQLELILQKNPQVVLTKEPGGTDVGLKLRDLVLNSQTKSKIAEMFLFLADRAEHTQEIIVPHKNEFLVSDRSFVSGIAYAVEFDIDELLPLNDLAIDGNYPDKVVMLELTRDELIKRLKTKDNDGIESRGVDYLMGIQTRMKQTLERLDIEYLVLNASDDIYSIAKNIEEFIQS